MLRMPPHVASAVPTRARLARAGLLLTCLVGALIAAGCGDEEPRGRPPGVPDTPVAEHGAQAVPQEALAFDKAWWQRRPPARLLLTGGQRGKLKPCGCSSPQLGGLKRMAAVLHQLRRRAAENDGVVAAVSLGWSMRGNFEPQEEAKADFLRAVHESLGFSATLLGAPDLLVPAMCQPRGPGAETPRPPLNVFVGPAHAAMDSTAFADLAIGSVQLRAFSLLEAERAEELRAGGHIERVMGISQALGGLSPKPDTFWLVAVRAEDDATLATVRSSLQRLGPGVIVDLSDGAAGGVRKLDRVHMKAGSEPAVLEIGELGKAVGVIDFEPGPGGDGHLVSFRRIELVPQWEKYGQTLTKEVAELDALYREMVKGRGYLQDFLRGPDRGATYVGSSACAKCHAAIYNDWKRTPHYIALETLEKANYDWDPECIRCHVVGWTRTGPDAWYVTESAFRTPAETPFLGGVGCENCHGPGSAHVASPWERGQFAAGGPMQAAPGKRTCVACHDAENSHGFLEGYESAYLPEVDHRRVPADLRTVLPEGYTKPREPAQGPDGGK